MPLDSRHIYFVQTSWVWSRFVMSGVTPGWCRWPLARLGYFVPCISSFLCWWHELTQVWLYLAKYTRIWLPFLTAVAFTCSRAKLIRRTTEHGQVWDSPTSTQGPTTVTVTLYRLQALWFIFNLGFKQTQHSKWNTAKNAECHMVSCGFN